MSATYSEKLRDPKWQKLRLRVMEYAEWRCQICGISDRTLHCHHSYYTKGKQPWQYPDGSIICICDRCHEKIHGKPKPEPASTPPAPPADEDSYRPPGAIPLAVAKKLFAELKAKLERKP